MFTNAIDQKKTSDIRLVVRIEGGLVQAVYANCPAVIRVAIMDYDIQGGDPDEMLELEDGTRFLGHIEETFESPCFVPEVFAAFDETVPVMDGQQQHYLAHKGMVCPVCGESDTEADRHFDADGLNASVTVRCNPCASTWTDHYQLVGFDNLVGAVTNK